MDVIKGIQALENPNYMIVDGVAVLCYPIGLDTLNSYFQEYMEISFWRWYSTLRIKWIWLLDRTLLMLIMYLLRLVYVQIIFVLIFFINI